MREEKAIIHCCVERDVYEMLSRHCELTGQTKTTAIKRALRAYCDGKPEKVEPAARPAAEPR